MDRNKKVLMQVLGISILAAWLLFLLYSPGQGGGWQGDGTPPYTIAEGTVRGGVFLDGGHGYAQENPYTEYFELPEGEVKYARLYVPVWNYNSGNSIQISVNGNKTADRQEPDYISAWGTGLYCIDLTKRLLPGQNEISVLSDNPDGGPYGLTLAAVYQNDSMPPTRFWINEGNYALAYRNKKDSITSTFKGTLPGKTAKLQTLLIAGTEGETDWLYFDSELIGTDVGRSADGRYFDLYEKEVHPKSQESTLRFERGDEGYLHPCVAVLVSEADSEEEFLEVYEQKAVQEKSVPMPVILVTLLACLALILRYGKKR